MTNFVMFHVLQLAQELPLPHFSAGYLELLCNNYVKNEVHRTILIIYTNSRSI